jgi:hypothetical protein
VPAGVSGLIPISTMAALRNVPDETLANVATDSEIAFEPYVSR